MTRLIFFFESPFAGGIVLILSALLAVILANSSLADIYFHALHMEVAGLATHLWINDALMAIFFLFVGLEVKREMMIGQLNTNAKRLYPGLAAVCGFVVPGIIYYAFTMDTMSFARGWAVPTATDIAFALGVLALVERKVPASLKVFLTALAVIDDLMAIVVIALFYSANISWLYLGMAAMITLVLVILNKTERYHPLTFSIIGIALWYCVFMSGLHATLAGVILALTIPLKKSSRYRNRHPLIEWEHALTNWVTFLIIPIFGFANAGVSFADSSLADLTHPIVLGIAIGLFVGKQIGVFGLSYMLVKTKFIPMPDGANWRHIYGISLLCGIGFTMSLFVSMLAFSTPTMLDYSKIGIFLGSIISALLGCVVLLLGDDMTA